MIFIKRHIGIQRTVFLSPGCGNRRIHLPVDTQSGKAEKGGSLLSIIILHRLKEADHSLLDQIFILSAQKIHGIGFFADLILVFFHDMVQRIPVAFPVSADQFFIRHLPVIWHPYASLPLIPHLFSVFAPCISQGAV